MEHGEARLHGETIVKLSRILGVSTDEILGVERTKSRGSSAPRGKFWKAFQLAARLPERDQRAVARLISLLASGQGLRSEDDSSRARRAS